MKFMLIFLWVCVVNCAEQNSDSNQLVFVKTVEDDEIAKVDTIEVSDEKFVATNEWQTVKKNQAIPRGLHVRMNVQTGETEAKLLDKNNEKENRAGYEKTKENYEKLKSSLRQLNDEILKASDEIAEKTETERETEIKSKFRSYDELKEEMSKMNMNLQTDAELLTTLVEQFNTSTDKAEKLRILADFEYYVHQFDNGVLLCDLGGFDLIMKELNNTEDLDIKTESALVLGSALQSNPKVKVKAVKSELLQLILNLLSKVSTHSDLANQNLISRLVFALSGTLRNFPFAQDQFIRFGGVEVLSQILARPFYPTKLKVKIVTLTKDLMLEKYDATTIANYDTNSSSKYQQYLKLDLVEKLLEANWCDNFEVLLESAPDHDTHEKLFDSISNMVVHCLSKIQPSLIARLRALGEKYAMMSKEETENSDDNYFLKLSNSIGNILKLLEHKKTEL